MSLETKLPDLIAKAGHSELYGLDFSGELGPAHQQILKKFMIANKDDLNAASLQLEKTLKWRKEFRPLNTIDEAHGDLGKLAVLTISPSGKVVTWNLYGAARSADERAKLFGELDKFLRWRVSVMERGIRLMDLSDPETAYMDQVHDYKDVSFLRLDGATKKASSTTIQLFQDYYPEFLSAKYFVNVPKIMTWMFSLARAFMSQETADKFHVVGNGKELRYVLGEWIPKDYGGNAQSLVAIAADESLAKAPIANTTQASTQASTKDAHNVQDASSDLTDKVHTPTRADPVTLPATGPN